MSFRESPMRSTASRTVPWTTTSQGQPGKKRNQQAGAFRSPCLGDRDRRITGFRSDSLESATTREGCFSNYSNLGSAFDLAYKSGVAPEVSTSARRLIATIATKRHQNTGTTHLTHLPYQSRHPYG